MAEMSPGRAPAGRAFVIALVLMVLGVLGTLQWQAYQARFVYGVEVDGQFLGYVSSREAWEAALAQTRLWAESNTGLPVVLESNIVLTKTLPHEGQEIILDQPLLKACRGMVRFVTEAWAVTVDGREVVYLRTEDEAREVIDSLAADCERSLMEKGNTRVLSVAPLEDLDIRRTDAPAADVADVETAKRILKRGTDRLEVHVVSRGESLWSIANANSLSVDDLRKANPDLADSDLIFVGQELNLIVPDPYVNLASVEEYTYIKYLPYGEEIRKDSTLWPWESYVKRGGVYGRREVTVRIERLNEEEVSRELVSSRLLSSPTTQVFILGTKTWPTRAGGWVYPAVGRTTSPFGWRRSGFHHGIDIGAPYGDGVMAAKGGTVTYAGWRGSYGRLVVIDHGDGLETRYAHLSSILVSVGQVVSQGEVIGKIGNSGRSYGSHLHFEIRVDGKAVNPVTYYPRGG